MSSVRLWHRVCPCLCRSFPDKWRSRTCIPRFPSITSTVPWTVSSSRTIKPLYNLLWTLPIKTDPPESVNFFGHHSAFWSACFLTSEQLSPDYCFTNIILWFPFSDWFLLCWTPSHRGFGLRLPNISCPTTLGSVLLLTIYLYASGNLPLSQI